MRSAQQRKLPPMLSSITSSYKSALTTSTSTSNRRIHHLYFAIFLVFYVVLTQREYSCQNDRFQNDNFQDPVVTSEQQQEKHPPRLGDGCYHVFLDVGANVGVHGRFLFEPYKYPHSLSSVDLFAKEYGFDKDCGMANNKDVCVFAFEANPKHWPRLHEISNAYQAMGWRYHVVEAAVADYSGSAPFYHQGKLDEVYNEWGFSGAKDISQDYEGNISEGGYIEMVPTIRLAEWILHHIYERRVPEIRSSTAQPPNSTTTNTSNANNSANRETKSPNDDPRFKPTTRLPFRETKPPLEHRTTTSPILGMKIDIEGYEYIVIPDLIHTGAICNFDFLFGEYHSKFAPILQFRQKETKSDGNANSEPQNNTVVTNSTATTFVATSQAISNNDNNFQQQQRQQHFQPFHRVALDTTTKADTYAWCLSMVIKASRNCKVRWMYSDDEMYLYDGPLLPKPGDSRPKPKPIGTGMAKGGEKRKRMMMAMMTGPERRR